MSASAGSIARVRGAMLTLVALATACGVERGLLLGTSAPADLDAATLDAGSIEACPGCTTPVAFGPTTLTPDQGGDGSAPLLDLCPPSQAVIGYQGAYAPPSIGIVVTGQLQTLCGTVAVQGAPAGALVVDAGATLALRGGSSSVSPWTHTCPPDEVVVGFVGRSGVALDNVAFVCAPWTRAALGQGLVMGAEDTLTAEGGDGGSPYADACPPGQIAVGSLIAAGDWIDSFGLACAPPTALDGGAL